MMKKYLIAVVVVLLGVSFLYPVTKLDVKTKFKEKYELKGVKYGVMYFLKGAGYKIVEVGEDYAVWLTEVKEEREEPDAYTLTLTVHITPPAMFKQKKSIVSGEVVAEFAYNPGTMNVDDTGFLRFVEAKVKNVKDKEKIRAYIVGRAVAEKVKELLDGLKD